MTLRHVTWTLGRDYPGGATALAKDINKPGKVTEQKLGLHDQSHIPNIEDLELYADCCAGGNMAVATYFAQKDNAVVVALPNDNLVSGDMSLLESFMDVCQADGSFAYEFKCAWEDGRITPQEFARLVKIKHDSIGKQLALLKQIEGLVR